MIRKLGALTLAVLGFTAIAALLGWFVWPDRAPELPSPEVTLLEPATPTVAPALRTDTIKLRKRDTMVAALLRHDVPSAVAHEITGALRAAGANLRLLKPGDELELARANDGRPVMLAFAPNAWSRFEA
ncbi:MAG: hypothetical protein Q7T25_04610, partial [Sideroxyarcus sp.]|nr:hypothetical protein [Sideroxyarcus sp.]